MMNLMNGSLISEFSRVLCMSDELNDTFGVRLECRLFGSSIEVYEEIGVEIGIRRMLIS